MRLVSERLSSSISTWCCRISASAALTAAATARCCASREGAGLSHRFGLLARLDELELALRRRVGRRERLKRRGGVVALLSTPRGFGASASSSAAAARRRARGAARRRRPPPSAPRADHRAPRSAAPRREQLGAHAGGVGGAAARARGRQRPRPRRRPRDAPGCERGAGGAIRAPRPARCRRCASGSPEIRCARERVGPWRVAIHVRQCCGWPRIVVKAGASDDEGGLADAGDTSERSPTHGKR